MAAFSTMLARRKDGWALMVETPDGRELQYHYPSLAQARFFAAVFSLGPSYYPEPKPARKVRKQSRRTDAPLFDWAATPP